MGVILIHGQGRTLLSMIWLGRRLARQGYQVHYFGYATFTQGFDSIVSRFVQTVRAKTASSPYIIVSHSLGGIITRSALPHLADHLPQHLVMLAPPNQPAALARRMRVFPPYRWFTRDCGQKLGDEAFYQSLPHPTIPTTIIAGTRGWPTRAPFFEGRPNDLVLAVDETRLEGCPQVLVPATHPLIMNSKQVAQLVLDILQNCRAT
jgi:hypothetical protein